MLRAMRRAPSTSASPAGAASAGSGSAASGVEFSAGADTSGSGSSGSSGSGAAAGSAGGLGPDLGSLLLGGALDVGGAGLGGLHDRANLVGRGLRKRFGAAPLLGALECVHLTRELRQERVHRLRLVAPAADGEVALLDGLTVERHGAEA